MGKAYAIILGLVLVLFALFFKDRAFMGKSQDALRQADHAVDATGAPPSQAAQPDPAAAQASPEAAQTPAAENMPGEPEKGTVGARLKQIREDRNARNKALEDSANQ